MPVARPAEEIPSIPLPIINGGYLHLHTIWAKGKWEWMPRIRPHRDICGTHRCVILKVNAHETGPPCEHDWKLPEPGMVICSKCGDHTLAKFDLSQISN